MLRGLVEGDHVAPVHLGSSAPVRPVDPDRGDSRLVVVAEDLDHPRPVAAISVAVDGDRRRGAGRRGGNHQLERRGIRATLSRTVEGSVIGILEVRELHAALHRHRSRRLVCRLHAFDDHGMVPGGGLGDGFEDLGLHICFGSNGEVGDRHECCAVDAFFGQDLQGGCQAGTHRGIPAREHRGEARRRRVTGAVLAPQRGGHRGHVVVRVLESHCRPGPHDRRWLCRPRRLGVDLRPDRHTFSAAGVEHDECVTAVGGQRGGIRWSIQLEEHRSRRREAARPIEHLRRGHRCRDLRAVSIAHQIVTHLNGATRGRGRVADGEEIAGKRKAARRHSERVARDGLLARRGLRGLCGRGRRGRGLRGPLGTGRQQGQYRGNREQANGPRSLRCLLRSLRSALRLGRGQRDIPHTLRYSHTAVYRKSGLGGGARGAQSARRSRSSSRARQALRCEEMSTTKAKITRNQPSPDTPNTGS